MAFAKINGINLYYELQGEGQPIVFVSGFATHRETWREFSNRLSANYKTLIFDNRGAGQSDAPPPPYSIEMMAKDTKDLMDHLGIEKVGKSGEKTCCH